METVTELEVTWDVLRRASEAAALLAVDGWNGDVVVETVRERYGVASTSRTGALREMIALIGLLVLVLEEIGPEYGVSGASVVVPAEGWS